MTTMMIMVIEVKVIRKFFLEIFLINKKTISLEAAYKLPTVKIKSEELSKSESFSWAKESEQTTKYNITEYRKFII